MKDGGRSVVAWQGAGTLDYTVSSHKVDISVGYVHSRVDKHKMRLSIVVHFPPHGWVRLPETVLQLAGNASSVSFLIPQDVTEENLIASTKFPGIQADVERVYGKRLPEECRDLVKRCVCFDDDAHTCFFLTEQTQKRTKTCNLRECCRCRAQQRNGCRSADLCN